jgi:hypothetical protein
MIIWELIIINTCASNKWKKGTLILLSANNPISISIGTPMKISFIETELPGETRVDLGFEPT